MKPIHPSYPLPDVEDPVMSPFWEGARAHKLMQQREIATGRSHWPPKPMYWKGGGKLEWFEASGHGEIYTYVVAYPPFLPALEHKLPHIMVVVQLAEGARVVGYMIDCTPEQMSFGMPVRVAFEDLTDKVTLPVWRPAAN